VVVFRLASLVLSPLRRRASALGSDAGAVAAFEPGVDPLPFALSLRLRTLGLATAARLFALPCATCLVSRVALGEFEVQTLELEDLTLLAPDLIRDRGRLAPILRG
jgi:hypothetical protein